MELKHPIIILLYAFDELKAWPFVSLKNRFGRLFFLIFVCSFLCFYFCVSIFVFLFLCFIFMFLFLCGLTQFILQFWVCQTHWTYAQIIFSTSFANQDGLNEDAYTG